jgi:hypothetical protein
MAGHILKSPSITNLDASPIVANTIGEGGPGFVRMVSDVVTTVSADDNTSTYRMVRIPTNAKVKKVVMTSAAASAGAADIDVAFSDSTTDGTQQSLAGGIVQVTGPVDNKLFGAASSLVAQTKVDITTAGTFTLAMQNLPLWQVLVNLGATQFTADPGGFFDILVRVTTTITTGGILQIEVWYVE